MDEGRIVNTAPGVYQYEYFLQDHLYNNRVTFRPNADGTPNLTQVQNYYPFGADMGDATMNYFATPQNLRKYNGNEWQPGLNLNTYDFGARHYDPALARWMTLDPLAEESDELSPYNYVENNPMNLIDPDGMQPNGGGSSSIPYLGLGTPSGTPGNVGGWDVGGSAAGSLGSVGNWVGWGVSAVTSGIAANKAFGLGNVSTQNWGNNSETSPFF